MGSAISKARFYRHVQASLPLCRDALLPTFPCTEAEGWRERGVTRPVLQAKVAGTRGPLVMDLSLSFGCPTLKTPSCVSGILQL